MQKEIIIIAVIIVLILIGDYFTGNYGKEIIESTTNSLNNIKQELKNEDINEDKVKTQLENLNNGWEEAYPKMAYFIEHDELEKVETSLTTLTSFFYTKEYSQSISEIDKTMFVLQHIRQKNEVSLENIF